VKLLTSENVLVDLTVEGNYNPEADRNILWITDESCLINIA